jgi:uncharacterized protein
LSDLFHETIWFVPVSIFLAGVVGSPHCMSMCGPIVLNFANKKAGLFAYQMGRMVAYGLAGAAAGGFGEVVLGRERPVWLINLSLVTIGLLLFFNGYRAIAGKSLHLPLPAFMTNFSMKLWKKLRTLPLPPSAAAGIAGVLTVFLPCGHLYSFLIGAVAMGGALKGAGFMFAFWLGSAPLLSFGAVWLQKLLHPTIAGGQRWAGVLLIVAGLFSILAFGANTENFLKPNSDGAAATQSKEPPLYCH